MSHKVCLLVAIANKAPADIHNPDSVCIEFDCALYMRHKQGWECYKVIEAKSLDAIGKLLAIQSGVRKP